MKSKSSNLIGVLFLTAGWSTTGAILLFWQVIENIEEKALYMALSQSQSKECVLILLRTHMTGL